MRRDLGEELLELFEGREGIVPAETENEIEIELHYEEL